MKAAAREAAETVEAIDEVQAFKVAHVDQLPKNRHAVLFFDPMDFAESCPRRSSYAGFPAGEAALQERRLRGPPGLGQRHR
jgi:hypothetical protein